MKSLGLGAGPETANAIFAHGLVSAVVTDDRRAVFHRLAWGRANCASARRTLSCGQALVGWVAVVVLEAGLAEVAVWELRTRWTTTNTDDVDSSALSEAAVVV